MTAAILMTLSAAIIGLMGFVHLLLTFRGPRLLPRDKSLKQAMEKVAPMITSQTTIWRMWIGFNASHSMGALLFGLVYGYLALAHGDLLFQSVFLQVAGFAMLVGFVVLAKLYWFVTPLLGGCLSLMLYVISVAVAWNA
ncbi:MAG: hypothetical protein MUP90_04895 [Gammaproteobacteria bacterium]|nr:hypothetical protein [Gammaproteobacteria bacterium]